MNDFQIEKNVWCGARDDAIRKVRDAIIAGACHQALLNTVSLVRIGKDLKDKVCEIKKARRS